MPPRSASRLCLGRATVHAARSSAWAEEASRQLLRVNSEILRSLFCIPHFRRRTWIAADAPSQFVSIAVDQIDLRGLVLAPDVVLFVPQSHIVENQPWVFEYHYFFPT